MSKKTAYKFTNKDHPKKGIMSAILGAISIGTLIFVIYFSYRQKGAVQSRYAATVLLVLIFAFAGIVAGFLGVTEKDKYHFFPILGMLLNIIALAIISLILYAGAYGA